MAHLRVSLNYVSLFEPRESWDSNVWDFDGGVPSF